MTKLVQAPARAQRTAGTHTGGSWFCPDRACPRWFRYVIHSVCVSVVFFVMGPLASVGGRATRRGSKQCPSGVVGDPLHRLEGGLVGLLSSTISQ